MDCSVLLIDPRYAHNVGAALRACALLGARSLFWTGHRVPPVESWPEGARLPREERMKCYKRTAFRHIPGADYLGGLEKLTPVCVEITDSAEDLRDFVHPDLAVYVFGPEDGSIPKGTRMHCHRFLRIPVAIPEDDPDARTPYNLAAAVNLVLYDRFVKMS